MMMTMPSSAFMVLSVLACTVYGGMKGTHAQVYECKKSLELNCGAASAPGIADNEHLCTPMCMDFLCSVETAGCEDGAYYSESVVPLLGAAPGCVDQESLGCGGGPSSPCSLKDIVGVPPASPAKCTPWPPVSNGTKFVCEADYCAGVKCASPEDFEKCGGCKSGACFPCPAEPANKPTPSQLVCQTAMTTLYGGACNGTTAGTLRSTNSTMICGDFGFPRGYAKCNTTECTACGAALATLKEEECKTEEAYANFVVPVDVEGGAITTTKAIARITELDNLCEVRKQRLETEKCAGAGYTLVNDGKCFSAGNPIAPAVCGLDPNATVCNERAKSMLENCKSSVCSVGVDEGCTPVRALADATEVDWYGPANGLLNGLCVQMAAQTTTTKAPATNTTTKAPVKAVTTTAAQTTKEKSTTTLKSGAASVGLVATAVAVAAAAMA